MCLRFLFLALFTASSLHGAFFDAYDWEARLWKQSVLTNSFTDLPGKSYLAGITWMKMVRQAGLRDRVLRVNLCIGGAVSGSPSVGPPFAAIIHDAGNAFDFSGGATGYTEADGFTVTGNGEAIQTNFNPTNLTVNDAHLAAYLGGTAGAGIEFAMGVTAFAGNHFFLIPAYTAVGEGAPIWATPYPTAADTDGRGFYVGSRTSGAATGVAIYRNGVKVGTSSSVGGSPPDTTGTSGVTYMAVNSNGAIGGFTTKKGRGYQIGRGITDAQVATFYIIWQQLESTFGRVSP